MPFLKEDLIQNHYNWHVETTSSIFKGQPSRRLFDRFNGDQILFIINFYASVSDRISIKEGRKMEEMINDSLPKEYKSEIAVFNWLRSAY
jgi:hypothetical protein